MKFLSSPFGVRKLHMCFLLSDIVAVAVSYHAFEGMTVLIVAHRLSTIRNADLIFVVKDGKVVEEGSHADLIKIPDGAYSSLIRRQMDIHKKLEAGPSSSNKAK